MPSVFLLKTRHGKVAAQWGIFRSKNGSSKLFRQGALRLDGMYEKGYPKLKSSLKSAISQIHLFNGMRECGTRGELVETWLFL
jgi:hypothetical protein